MKIELNRILFFILILMLSFFTVTTIVVITKRNIHPKIVTQFSPEEMEKRISAFQEANLSSFTGIERLRVVTKPEKEGGNGVSIVITPWFSYTKDDSEFLEELSKKVPKIRTILREWFSRYTLTEIKSMGETAMKMELIDELNKALVLNKIQGLYFSEFVYLD